jgi:hypothetical protein
MRRLTSLALLFSLLVGAYGCYGNTPDVQSQSDALEAYKAKQSEREKEKQSTPTP